jgi:hypothetical protein
MAVLVPKLPPGYVAQMAAHRDIGDTCYEFRRVYDTKNVLVQELSYWLVTPIGDDAGPDSGYRAARAISFEAYLEKGGTLGYSAFSSPTVPIDDLKRWIDGRVAAEAAGH